MCSWSVSYFFAFFFLLSLCSINIASTDIKSWFERTTSVGPIGKASSVDFQRCEKLIDMPLPKTLKLVLSEANGGLWLMDKELLSTEAIARVLSAVQSSTSWRGLLIPIAGEPSTGLLVLNANTNEVLEWDEEDGLGDSVAASLTGFLESYRDSLLEGHCEYLRDVGVVEKVARSRK